MVTDTGGPLLKGSILRGYARFVQGQGWLEAVCDGLPEDTVELVRHPPLPSAWVSVRHTVGMLRVVADRYGVQQARAMSRAAVVGSYFVYVRPLLRGALQLFGTRPSAIFSRVGLVMKESSRGYTFDYRDDGPSAGAVIVRSKNLHECPATVNAWAGGFEAVLDVCGATGIIEVESIVHEGPDSISTLACRWNESG